MGGIPKLVFIRDTFSDEDAGQELCEQVSDPGA
jgi:hypothetical protein